MNSSADLDSSIFAMMCAKCPERQKGRYEKMKYNEKAELIFTHDEGNAISKHLYKALEELMSVQREVQGTGIKASLEHAEAISRIKRILDAVDEHTTPF